MRSKKAELKYYEKNRERLLALQKQRRKDPKYRARRNQIMKRSYRKAQNAWGSHQGHLRGKEVAKIANQTELFVAQTILPKHGFTDIILCRVFAGQFPFDILAKKDGKRVAVEVTTSLQRSLKPEKNLLLNFMDAELYICHLKLDLSRYYLLPVDLDEKPSSSVRGIFMQSIKGKSPFVRFAE